MNTAIRFAIRVYAAMLYLYPRSFRAEFGEEMRAVFAEAVAESAGRSGTSLIAACLRELCDWPKALLVQHWLNLIAWTKEAIMYKTDTPGILPAHRGPTRHLATLTGRNPTVKRLFDLAFAGLCLIVTAPLLLVIAVLVRLDSPGPALFRQRRVGRNGRPFTMYKFRSMIRGAEKMQAPADRGKKGDPRVTRVGRFIRTCNLDELPQLFNVLRGDLSVLGPPPELLA